ncbi:hypothetical protein Z517_04335 [Fonsecaea pedrosoi CBS 271.37]|uniref:INO80 complex subunit 4 n=1 Tax=Fonsecaea pedrosoi CBS 271.37 TaxID=1442368 RepID=A0A0D2GRW7_9EURO|nr:uncharacterized protein Z517_04335 [Fonsecaea pedrosoi CBS 271.37]KIW81310.1 hypothetical protein Z517_04335 [Fonsecaea pedrosoi CBS 271.37]
MAMSSSSTAGRSPSATAKPDKNKKQVKILTLKLSPQVLRRFEEPPAKSEEQSTASVASSPPATVEETSTLKVPEVNEDASEAASTPAPTSADAADTSNGDGSKKRKGGSLAGTKRSLGQMSEVNGLPRPRGKPGPKKKPRLEDGTIDHGGVKASTPAGINIGHKLGPKANQGAINAGLRALDRSGKPCRKWSKKPFTLKSFTGVVWELASWRGQERPQILNGEESSDTNQVSHQGSSDVKPNESDVAMDSNAGDQAEPMLMSTPAASSPAPMPPPSAAIAAQG